MEIWNKIVGYEGVYEVSNFGSVKSLERVVQNSTTASGFMKVKGMLINSRMGKDYINITLTRFGKKNTFNIHRLVAIAFLENPENLPFVNHKDGNKLNNLLDNLEWSTEKENTRHAYSTGLIPSGSSSHYAKLDERSVAEIIFINKTTKLTYSLIGKLFGVCPESVSNMCRGKSWKHPHVREVINGWLSKLEKGTEVISVDLGSAGETKRNWRRR